MDASPQTIDFAHLDDATYNRLYKERIEPCFIANEGDRQAAVKKFWSWFTIGLVLTIVLVTALAAFEQPMNLIIIAVLGGAILSAIVAYQPLAKVGQTLKRQYCSAIAEAMGVSFKMGGFDPPAFPRICSLRLAPSFDRSKFEDLFHGGYRNSSFDLYEAHLEQRTTDSKGRTRYNTVFRGQLIRMHFPIEFLGVTIVRRDAGVFNVFGGGDIEGRKLERVRLVASEFEKAFEVWGTDQVEARYLLHPVMMERLIALETALHGKRIRCAFENGDLLVAVEGGNLFEPGDLFKPLVDPSRARRIVDEIASVVKVMDQVLTAQNTRPR